MIKFGAIVRLPGSIMGNSPFVYAMTETMDRAKSICTSYKIEHPKSECFPAEIVDTALIGDYYDMVKSQ